jgi:hypothetical protein
MSGIFDATGGGLVSFGLAAGASLLGVGQSFRSIGGIVAQCTIEERHTDTMTVTRHPVELGTSITDHAFMNPVEVDITIGWGTGQITPLSQIYQQLLDLQKSAQPFDIVTGKRKYSNMLITSIGETTDADTENALKIYLTCQEIITVQTQTSSVGPSANQANPQDTSDVSNTGTVQISDTTIIPGGSFLA